MKKYVLLTILFIATLTSCSLENDDANDFSLEILPIESVNMPEQFVHGTTYEISMTYTKPSSCYVFNDFIYDINGHERTVAIVNTVYANGNCVETPESVTVSFDFLVTGSETYIFKFYQGEDDEGVDQYYIVEVPVVDSRFNSGSSIKN